MCLQCRTDTQCGRTRLLPPFLGLMPPSSRSCSSKKMKCWVDLPSYNSRLRTVICVLLITIQKQQHEQIFCISARNFSFGGDWLGEGLPWNVGGSTTVDKKSWAFPLSMHTSGRTIPRLLGKGCESKLPTGKRHPLYHPLRRRDQFLRCSGIEQSTRNTQRIRIGMFKRRPRGAF